MIQADKRTMHDLEIMRDWHYAMYRANCQMLNAIDYHRRRTADFHVWEGLLEWAMYRSEAADLREALAARPGLD